MSVLARNRFVPVSASFLLHQHNVSVFCVLYQERLGYATKTQRTALLPQKYTTFGVLFILFLALKTYNFFTVHCLDDNFTDKKNFCHLLKPQLKLKKTYEKDSFSDRNLDRPRNAPVHFIGKTRV